MGLVQNDIKRVLAYSTVSQLGYMFLACGVGAFTAGIFHLMTHAFFKALLFLGSGSVIHAHVRRAGHAQDGRAVEQDSDHGEDVRGRDDRHLRESRRWPDSSARTPFWARAFEHSPLLWVIGFITAGMTAFYMFRLVNMTFFGESRVSHEVEHHMHESPPFDDGAADDSGGALDRRRMDWLAGIAGRQRPFRAIPRSGDRASMRKRRRRSGSGGSHGTEYLLMLASVLVALVGIWLA